MNFGIVKSKNNDTNIDEFGNYHSSFTARMLNAECEIEETQNFVKKESSLSNLHMEWPKIGLSPIN